MRFAVLFTLILFVLWMLHFAGLPKMFSPGMAISTDMTPVEIFLKNGAHLRIPKAYLVNVKNWKGGEQELLVIHAVLPELRPRKPEEEVDRKNMVFLHLDGMTDQNMNFWMKMGSDYTPYFLPSDSELKKLDDGYFKKKELTVKGSYPPHEDIYWLQNEDRFVRVSCKTSPPSPTCNVYTNFELLKVSYYINKSHIPQNWALLDGKIMQLLRSFTVAK